MRVFCTDLDNTIIYSYRHNIGDEKINVELYEGRKVSFISEKTSSLLKKVNSEMIIIPVSTRTEEQYKRINLGIDNIHYALVCNGGILLIDGKQDTEWYENSLALIKESKNEIDEALKFLENDTRRKFELRFIDGLFVFTKCIKPENVVKCLKEKLNIDLVNVFNNGEKIYVVPVNLSKGMALKRLRKKLNPRYIIAAGDSEFDLTMVEEADYGLVPNGFSKNYLLHKEVIEMRDDLLFSEALLEKILKIEAELR